MINNLRLWSKMKIINDLSNVIESMLDLTDSHEFDVKFKRLDSGRIQIITSDGFGEIDYTLDKNCELAIQNMIENCQDWVDESSNQDDSGMDEEDE